MTTPGPTSGTVAVWIAVGTLAVPRRVGGSIQRGMNHDFEHQAEMEGRRYIEDGHWSSFTVERRWYPEADNPRR